MQMPYATPHVADIIALTAAQKKGWDKGGAAQEAVA